MTIVARAMVRGFGGTATVRLVPCASVKVGRFGSLQKWSIGLKSVLRSMGKLNMLF
jgi:hypothetical protein